ncbi:MAG: hypothetical protein ABIS45_10145 [Burkholderiales bacterium]
MTVLTRLVRNLFRAGEKRLNGAVAAPAPLGVPCEEFLQRADAAAKSGRLAAALEIYRACTQVYPRSLDAWLGAAGVLVDFWLNDDAVAAYERALEIAPKSGAIFSALLFHCHYASPFNARRSAALHRRYGAQMQEAWPPSPCTHDADPQRRLRIGYVSPNFSRHSVGYFIAPVLRCHDRGNFEVFCYYTHALSDDATGRMRDLADGWRHVADADDQALDRMVRDDRIDILVDLAGHSKGNRLGVFLRRPAPVQMTWLGYPDTTGLAAIDYRITDRKADAEQDFAARHTETLLCMDDSFLCYEPPSDAPPVKSRESVAVLVFSSFNNIAKLNGDTILLWSRILAGVPEARLALKSNALKFPDTVDRVLDSFERAGVDPARVEVRGWIDERREHLDLYGGIDIALDTFPYNGTTTTCEALWMGVPVITLAGEVHMSRVGASILQSVGLDTLIAHNAADYVHIAIGLAHDAARRRQLRSELRARLAASPLLDHQAFTRKLETHYRQAWQVWCARRPAG